MSHLALGSKTDSIARSFEGHSIKCLNIYGLHIHESYLNEIIHLLFCQPRVEVTSWFVYKVMGQD